MTTITAEGSPLGGGQSAPFAPSALFRALVWPDRFFRPSIGAMYAVVPALLIIAVRVVVAKLEQPFFVHALRASITEAYAEPAMQTLSGFLRNKEIADFAHAILFTPAAILLTALVAFLFLLARGHLPSWGRLLAICSIAAVTALFRDILQFVILALRGVAAVQSAGDLAPPVGAGLLFRHSSYALIAAADGINIFDLWFVMILLIAFERSEQVPRKDALVAALGTWAMVQLFRCGTIYFFYQAL